jgi:hypothetical protein
MHTKIKKKESPAKKNAAEVKVNYKAVSFSSTVYTKSVLKVYEPKSIGKIDVTGLIGWQIM